MPLFVTVTPGTTVTNSTTLDATTLNLLGTPSVDVVGTVDGGSLTLSPGSVTTNTLGANVVSFAKLQQISGDKLIGRDTAGTGDAAEIGVDGGLEFSGSNSIRIQDGTSTTTGVTYAKIRHVSATSRLLGRISAGSGTIEEIAVGSGLQFSGGVLNTTKQTLVYSNTFTVPASGGGTIGISTTENHSLGGIPNIFRVYALLLTGPSAGYGTGDQVPIEAFVGNGYTGQAFTAWANSTSVGLVRNATAPVIYLTNKTTGAWVQMTDNAGSTSGQEMAKWQIVFEAIRYT